MLGLCDLAEVEFHHCGPGPAVGMPHGAICGYAAVRTCAWALHLTTRALSGGIRMAVNLYRAPEHATLS